VPVGASRIPQREVVGPAGEVTVDLRDDLGDRFERHLLAGLLSKGLSFPFQSFLRRAEVQVAMIAAGQVAVIPERVSQEV